MFFLGSLYREGFWGTTRDLARGLELIRRAAQLGLPRAQHHLGRLYLIDEIDLPRDPDQAFYWLLKAVESGEELAYCHLGLCYLDGLGVPPNEALATRMLARATRAGSASAAYNLAICLLIGRGVAEDHNQSFELLKVALEGGVTIATYQIALAYRFGLGAPRDPAQARLWLTKAVEAGVIRAKLDLAEFYLQGQGGPPLLEEGLNLLRAVSSPSANGPKDIARDAQFRLGLYLSEGGWGIKKDIAEAIHWISLAAQNDHLEANLFLAVWWREGRPGWPPNLEKSQGYLRRAEALGYKSPESEEASGEDWVPSPPVKVTLH
jgi:TPR repeat protein